MVGSRDDDADDHSRARASDDASEREAGERAGDAAGGPDAHDGDGLGAAWGGTDEDGSGGALPSESDAAASVEAEREEDVPEPEWVDRVTVVLVHHKTAFTVTVLAYGLLVMPWLYRNGYEGLGLAGGLLFLGGIVLVTVANAQAARQHVENVNERRGF